MKYRARITDLIMVSKKLAALDARFAFTGGAVVPLLLDHPELVVSRPTKDVDVIVEVVTRIQYTDLEERLRGIGFHHDIEDFLAVVDGRERLIDEIGKAPQPVREFIGQSVASFMTTQRFLDCLPGHLPPDAASQQRVPIVRDRLNKMAMLFGTK